MKTDPVFQTQMNLIDTLGLAGDVRENLKRALVGLHEVKELIMTKRISGDQGEERRLEAVLVKKIHAVIFGEDGSTGSCFIPSASGLCGIITERTNEIGHFTYQNLKGINVSLPRCFSYTARNFDEIKSAIELITKEERFAAICGREDTVAALPWGYRTDYTKPFVSDFEKDTATY